MVNERIEISGKEISKSEMRKHEDTSRQINQQMTRNCRVIVAKLLVCYASFLNLSLLALLILRANH